MKIHQSASRLSCVKEYYFSKKLKEIANLQKDGAPVINLGIGSPDLPPHPSVIDSMYENARQNNTHGYQSYQGIPQLRKAFTNWYQRYFDVRLDYNTEVLPLMGSKEGIMHIAMSYLQKGDIALIPNPGYPSYVSASNLAGATVIDYELKSTTEWFPDLEKIENSVDLSKVKIMWINYPHMPTGAIARLEDLRKLVDFAYKNNIILVNDNPYVLIQNDSPHSIFNVSTAKACAMELTSLSKMYNMAGWRVGVLTGAESFLKNIIKFKSNMDSGMFRATQMAAVQALSLPDQWIENLNQHYTERKKIAHNIFDSLGLEYSNDAAGLFVWGKIKESISSYEMSDQILHSSGVFITPGGIFGTEGNNYLRLSLCSPIAELEEAHIKIKQMTKNIHK